jgi:ABC-2 type transport system ATP-binding protein
VEPPDIEARNLTKTFRGGVVAVSSVDLAVPRGAVYGLVGRNGSGKTTLLRLLSGLLQPDEGLARVLGHDLWRAPRAVRARVAYVSQSQLLAAWMTLADFSRFVGPLYGRWDPAHARKLASAWGVPWNRPVGSLSTGEQRKAALLLAFAARPEVLVLDEPAGGFDLIARRQLIEEIIDAITQSDGCTVLVSTHQVGDLERIADRIGVMEKGRITLSTVLEDLLNRSRRVQVIFDDAEPPPGFALPGAIHCRRAGSVVNAVVRLADGSELDGLRNSAGVRVQVFPIGLEEILIEMFGRDFRNGDGAPD